MQNKKNSSSSSSSSGIGVLGLLQVAFIILKVLDLVNWSWPVVFIPTFIGIGLFVILIVFMCVITYFIKR